MKILFDHQVFTILNYGGVSRYFSELYRGLTRTEGFEAEISVSETHNINYHKIILQKEYVPPSQAQKIFRQLKGKIAPSTRLPKKNERLSIDKLSDHKFDIFHPTYYDPYFLKFLGGKPFVITVFDMIHELFPEYFAADKFLELTSHKRQLIENADHVIAISERTKNDILDIYPAAAGKISVIYLGSSIDAAAGAGSFRSILQLPKKYLLFVGTRDIYKNFQFFIESVQPLLLSENDLYIVCAGTSFTLDEEHLFARLKIREKMVQIFPGDDELIDVYRQALLFVYPSLYEGFGLPLLEAFSCGCPAAVSRTSSIPEVGGEAVIYFDPKDAQSIHDSITKIIKDPEGREDLVRKGYERRSIFSWEKTVAQTTAIYEMVLTGRKSS